MTHICILVSFSLSICSISMVLVDCSTWPKSYKEFGVTSAEFAPTSRSDPAKQLMLMNFTLCGWPRLAWPCKPKLSHPMAKDKTLSPRKLFGVSASWYFDVWRGSCSTQQSCWDWGIGGTALLFPKQHLWAPHHEVVWIRGTPVNSERATSEEKHGHQHGLTPFWIIHFSVENQKISKKWAFSYLWYMQFQWLFQR